MQTTYQMFIETAVPENELIVSRTDLKGRITDANETFAMISGYTVEELMGKSHNIVRHPDMPSSVFKQMWETLLKHEIWRGYVKNLRKDGGYYWVYAEVSGVYKDGKLVEYKSMRSPIAEEMKKQMQDRYDTMKKEEEDLCRVTVYLNTTNVAKLNKLAKDEGILADKLIDKILSDTLF